MHNQLTAHQAFFGHFARRGFHLGEFFTRLKEVQVLTATSCPPKKISLEDQFFFNGGCFEIAETVFTDGETILVFSPHPSSFLRVGLAAPS